MATENKITVPVDLKKSIEMYSTAKHLFYKEVNTKFTCGVLLADHLVNKGVATKEPSKK